MTVKELKDILKNVPDNREICFRIDSWDPDFDQPDVKEGIVNNAEVDEGDFNDVSVVDGTGMSEPIDVLIITGQDFTYLWNKKLEDAD